MGMSQNLCIGIYTSFSSKSVTDIMKISFTDWRPNVRVVSLNMNQTFESKLIFVAKSLNLLKHQLKLILELNLFVSGFTKQKG